MSQLSNDVQDPGRPRQSAGRRVLDYVPSLAQVKVFAVLFALSLLAFALWTTFGDFEWGPVLNVIIAGLSLVLYIREPYEEKNTVGSLFTVRGLTALLGLLSLAFAAASVVNSGADYRWLGICGILLLSVIYAFVASASDKAQRGQKEARVNFLAEKTGSPDA